MKKHIIIFLTFFLMAVLLLPASAYDLIPSEEYPMPDDSNMPEVLNIGTVLDCGDYSIRLMSQPVITKSIHTLIADNDWKYMVLRVGISNNGTDPAGWLTTDSFGLEEVYRNRIYGKYKLDYLMSAKSAAGYYLNPFYTIIAPGQTVQTALVFEIFPDADFWIFTFTPHMLGESAGESIRFRLPKAIIN